MIIDLTQFINSLRIKRHEVVLSIDANGDFDPRRKGIDILVSECQLMDQIAQAHGYINEPETYIRGTDRIDFSFCTLTILDFITAYEITTYDQTSRSDHIGKFLDINIQNFVENSFIKMIDHTARKIKTRETTRVVTYNQYLMELTNQHRIFDRTNTLKDKIPKDALTHEDMEEINDLDELITNGMLALERKIKKR